MYLGSVHLKQQNATFASVFYTFLGEHDLVFISIAAFAFVFYTFVLGEFDLVFRSLNPFAFVLYTFFGELDLLFISLI